MNMIFVHFEVIYNGTLLIAILVYCVQMDKHDQMGYKN